MEYRDIKSLKEQVGEVLNRVVDTRNDDALLVEIVCRDFGYNAIEKASSIERCRRWWQSTQYDGNDVPIRQGMYLPTREEVVKARRQSVDEWRVAMGYPTVAGSRTPLSEVAKPTQQNKGTMF